MKKNQMQSLISLPRCPSARPDKCRLSQNSQLLIKHPKIKAPYHEYCLQSFLHRLCLQMTSSVQYGCSHVWDILASFLFLFLYFCLQLCCCFSSCNLEFICTLIRTASCTCAGLCDGWCPEYFCTTYQDQIMSKLFFLVQRS